MTILGIDLSGPRNSAETYLTCFKEEKDQLQLQHVVAGADDEKILALITSLGKQDAITIGIDAPLSYNVSGGDRPSDKDLRCAIKEKDGHTGIMPPTMTRMVYLTLRGVVLTRLLQFDHIQIMEVHPGACMILHGAEMQAVKSFKRDVEARKQLLGWLEVQGVCGISNEESATDHYVAACAAAFGAWQWKSGRSIWKFPATLPHHPYDFAC